MYRFIILFFLSPLNIIAQNNYSGIYLGNNYEKDTVLKIVSKMAHKLILDKDSSFTYWKINDNTSCNSTYGGFWESESGKIILNFIGDDPQWMVINEGEGFCALENRKDKLTLIKQDYRTNSNTPSKVDPVKRKKKTKGPPCPSF